MANSPVMHHRRSIRLYGYNYSSAGAYFITLCVHKRERLFGDVVDDEMILNQVGLMIQAIWETLPERQLVAELDFYTVMPNHFHGILILNGRGEPCVRPASHNHSDGRSGVEMDDDTARPCGTLPNSIGRIIQAFKSLTTLEYIHGTAERAWPPFPGKLWQRNYFERVIRDEKELEKAREYIANNPLKWALDPENPDGKVGRTGGLPLP